jgi:hypothetical protein
MALSFRAILRCALPGVLLAVICVLPFVNKPFTIDDPYFLLEARQALLTPLTPTIIPVCWELVGHKRTLREIGSPGLLMGYILIPVVLLDNAEWAGHLWILLLLCAAVIATVAFAFRCGARPREALVAGLLFASTPAVLGMAGTVMPDVPCALLAAFGMERILAWQQERKLHQAIAAALALGLVPIARAHTVLLLPIAALILAGSPRKLRGDLMRWLPVALGAFVFVFLTWITFDGTPNAVPGAPRFGQVSIDHIRDNLNQFGIHWLLTAPLGLAWLIVSGRLLRIAVVAILAVGAMACYGLHRINGMRFPLGFAGLLIMAAVLLWAWRSGRPLYLWLALSLFIPFATFPYVHSPAKYILPCMPAAAFLIATRLSELSSGTDTRVPSRAFGGAWTLVSVPWFRMAIAAAFLIAAGTTLGVAILRADTAFSGLARNVVAAEIQPHVQAGGHAWYAGDWALMWYSEKAGAECLTVDPPLPQRGDLIIAGRVEDGPEYVQRFQGFNLRLVRIIAPPAPGGRVLNKTAKAGFYSNPYGYWPWIWSNDPVNTYYIWQVD